MTGNSIEKCFAVWNVIQNVLLILKLLYTAFALNATANTACFARNIAYPSNKPVIYRLELNL